MKTVRGPGMIIDGWIVAEDETITFAQGRQNAVDMIAGSNKDERTSFGGNVAQRDSMMWAARLFAERQAAQLLTPWHSSRTPNSKLPVKIRRSASATAMLASAKLKRGLNVWGILSRSNRERSMGSSVSSLPALSQ